MKMNPQWTGERLETFVFEQTTFEHLHRYAFARTFLKDKTVLDIACGDGYGSNFLSESANTVVGMDIDEATIQTAQEKYIKPNLKFQTGSITNIPFPDSSFDAVISFETIEHIADQYKMLSEIKRVLKENGLFIISTPDKKYFKEIRPYRNPFHLKELHRREFAKLLLDHFKNARLLQQNFVHGSILNDPACKGFEFFTGDYKTIISKAPQPMYWVAIASDGVLPEPSSSFFYSEEIYRSLLNQEIEAIKKSFTYRFGHFFLAPFKWLRSILNS